MAGSHMKNQAVTSAGRKGDGNSAEIISHPLRLSGGIAKRHILESRLAAQKQLAMMKIETAISCVEAMRTEDNASEVALMVEALLMALKEFQTLDPQHAPEREIFDRLANQLREVSVKFASAMSVA